MRASVAYDTTLLTADAENCHRYLEELVERVEGQGEVCADVPAEAFGESVKESDNTDITMYGTTSLASFSELIRNVPIDAIVKVQYKYPTKNGKVSHIVVVGPGGFQLCTCLKLMRCGLHCSHVLAALVTRLGRACEFVGESIHPRWRSSLGDWSLRKTALGDFEHAKFRGGPTDDHLDGAIDVGGDDGQATHSKGLKHIQAKAYADYVAKFMKWASTAAAKVDGSPASLQAFNAFVDVQEREFRAFVEGPRPNDRLAGLGNPPVSLPAGRKETRHKDAEGTEGGRKRGTRKAEATEATEPGGGGKRQKNTTAQSGACAAVKNAMSSFCAGR